MSSLTALQTTGDTQTPSFKETPFRACLTGGKERTLVFAVDVIAQPQYRSVYFKTDPLIHAKCARALPLAEEHDIVLLAGSLEPQYYGWLRSLGLGPATVFAFEQDRVERSLAELIAEKPEAIRFLLQGSGAPPLYVPFYGGESEQQASASLGIDLFGCSEETTLRYFNKESFKNECNSLGISTVEGITHAVSGREQRVKEQRLAEVVHQLLSSYPSVIVRGALGAAGSSVYKVEQETVRESVQTILDSPEQSLLIEPLLNVIASPNDQWAITPTGSIEHIGVSAQLFHGLKHVGNIKGQYFSKRVFDYIKETSFKIVQSMAVHGYQGIIGIDYIVSDSGIFPIENNARMNGSSFAIGIVEQLKRRQPEIRCWKFFKARTDCTSFDELRSRLGSFLYDGSATNSVFPFDTDAIPHTGIFTPLIVAEDMFHIEYLEEALAGLGIHRV